MDGSRELTSVVIKCMIFHFRVCFDFMFNVLTFLFPSGYFQARIEERVWHIQSDNKEIQEHTFCHQQA